MRKLIFLTMLLTFGAALAAPSYAKSTTPPDKVVQETATTVLTTIRKNKDKFKGNPEALYKLVEQDLAPHFDFDYAARLVLGRAWRDASAKQRKAFIDAFTHYLVNSYADELVKHAGAKVKVGPFRGKADDKRTNISSTIIPQDGKPIKVDYAMHRTSDGWKAFDVRAEGVSYVMSYRHTFQNEIRQTSLDALIARLQKKAKHKAKKASGE